MADRLRELLRELRPHAIFRIVEIGGGVVGLWLVNTFRQNPNSFLLVTAFAGGSFITFALLAVVRPGSISSSRPGGVGQHEVAAAAERLSDHSTLAASSQIRILPNNRAMEADISAFVAQNRKSIERVVVLQYSGRNIIGVVNEIWEKTHANIELYLADPEMAINDHQRDRITEMLYKFSNELSPVASGVGTLEIFAYRAPASLRVVLFDRQLLYIGAYFYKVVSIAGKQQLDTRGGEMPLLVVPSENPNFMMLSREVLEIVQNWTSHKVAVLVDQVPKKRS